MECAACNKEVSPDSYFCTWCNRFIPSPELGSKANLFARWVGWVIDPVIGIVLYFFSIMTIGVIFPPLAILAAILLPIAYFIWFLSLLRTGRTPGKLLMGLQVVDAQTGAIPGFGKMFLREIIGRILSGVFFGLGYLWALIDKNGQAFHDKLAGTVVLKGSRAAAGEAGVRSESRVPTGLTVGTDVATSTAAPQPAQAQGGQLRRATGAIVVIVVAAGLVLLFRGLHLGSFGGATAGASLNGQWRWEAGEEGTAYWVLSQNGRKLEGQYSWNSDPRPTAVHGKISPAGVITMREAMPRVGTEKAQYEGRLQPDGSIVGEQVFENWRNPWRLERAAGDAPKVQPGSASDPASKSHMAPLRSRPEPLRGTVRAANPAPVPAPTEVQSNPSAASREASERGTADVPRSQAERASVPESENWTFQELQVSATSPNVTKSWPLAYNAVYKLEVSGTYDAWGRTPHSVDAVACFADPVCNASRRAKLADGFKVNGQGLIELSGGTLQYSPEHVYSISQFGNGHPLEFYIQDARGSWRDNVGVLTVRLTREP